MRRFVVGAVVVGLAVRIALLVLPAAFLTDVYYYDTQAVAYLLRGVSPYGAPYTVPPNLSTPGAANVFAYLPGVFIAIAPLGAVTDVRFGLVACDLVVALALYLMAKDNHWSPAFYMLFPPAILFSTWFLNDSLPSIALVAVGILLQSRGKTVPASIFWGLAFVSSQEAWLLAPFYFGYEISRRRLMPVIVASASALIVVAPFLAANGTAFLYDTISFQFGRAAVPLVSSGPFGLNVNLSLQGVLTIFGLSAPVWLRGAILVLGLALMMRGGLRSLRSALGWGSAFTAFGLFVLPGELFWAYLELPLLTALAWFSLREGNTLEGSLNP